MSKHNVSPNRTNTPAENEALATMACPTCGATDNLTVHTEQGQVRAPDGTLLPYETAYTACERCGEEFLTRAQTRADSRAASTVLRRHIGLLTPEEIKAIRSRFRVSQEVFERVLGLGRKTVVRWETGRVNQGRAADLLLRAVRERPELFYEFAEREGVSLEQPALPQGVWRMPWLFYQSAPWETMNLLPETQLLGRHYDTYVAVSTFVPPSSTGSMEFAGFTARSLDRDETSDVDGQLALAA